METSGLPRTIFCPCVLSVNGQQHGFLLPDCGFLTFQTEEQVDLFCMQGQAHVLRSLAVRAQGSASFQPVPATGTELSVSGCSFLPQLFDEGHLISIPDTITGKERGLQCVIGRSCI